MQINKLDSDELKTIPGDLNGLEYKLKTISADLTKIIDVINKDTVKNSI